MNFYFTLAFKRRRLCGRSGPQQRRAYRGGRLGFIALFRPAPSLPVYRQFVPSSRPTSVCPARLGIRCCHPAVVLSQQIGVGLGNSDTTAPATRPQTEGRTPVHTKTFPETSKVYIYVAYFAGRYYRPESAASYVPDVRNVSECDKDQLPSFPARSARRKLKGGCWCLISHAQPTCLSKHPTFIHGYSERADMFHINAKSDLFKIPTYRLRYTYSTNL